MLYSLLIKLAMLAATMSVVFWIGWTVPQIRDIDPNRGARQQAHEPTALPSAGPPAVAAASPGTRLVEPHRSTEVLRQSALEKLDLNGATEQDLEALPGIGPVLAERIVEYRRSRGAFQDVDQLRKVKGIGKKKFDRIRALVDVTPSTGLLKGERKAT